MTILDHLYIDNIICYRIKDIDKNKLTIGFHPKTSSHYDKQILIDLLDSSEEGLLNEIENKTVKKKKKCRLNEESLIKYDCINSNWLKNKTMLNLMMNNDYYFIVYHKLTKSKSMILYCYFIIEEWIDYNLEEYNYSKNTEFCLNDCHFGAIGIEYLSYNISKLVNMKKLELKCIFYKFIFYN